jgi:hypothetical protein
LVDEIASPESEWDVDTLPGVLDLLDNIARMSSDKLMDIGAAIWGPGCCYEGGEETRARAEIVGFLLDQRDTLTDDDVIPGGIADGASSDEFDPNALADGVTAELEHTADENVAREIAMDHLASDPEYYKKLKVMEASG